MAIATGSAAAPTSAADGVYDDLRTFIDACQAADEWRAIDGIDWRYEMGALIESTAELIPEPPLLLFDNIKDHQPGFRVVGLLMASMRRGALAFGLPVDAPKLELARMAARKLREVRPLPPRVVASGTVL